MPQKITKESDKVSVGEMKAAIMRSGYLLEQRVEGILKKKQYIVQTNPIFPYPDTDISGEYDIDATKTFEIYKEGDVFNSIDLKLMCECKNNPQPLVFFVKEVGDSYLFRYDIKVSGIPVQFAVGDGYMGLSEFAGMGRYHHYCTGTISTQWCTFQLKSKEKTWMAYHSSEQHEPFDSLIKALDYQVGKHYDEWAPGLPQSKEVDIHIYYPLVILGGDLYSASLENGKLKLAKAELIHFSREFYSSKSDSVATYHFDIIRERYLSGYLKWIESEVGKIRNSLRRQKQKVLNSIDKIHEDIYADIKSKNETPISYRRFLEF